MKIFISHSSHDNAKALAVAQWLEEQGWGTPFLDIGPSHGLAPGERWRKALTEAAGRCEAVVCLVSPSWLNSGECRGEFSFASYLGKVLIGVIVDPAVEVNDVPDELRAWQICTLVKGEGRRLFTVQRDPLVPSTQVEFAQAGLTLLHQGLQASSLNPFEFPWPPSNDPDRAPYRGLRALEAEDAAIFFGRDMEIGGCLDRLRTLRQAGGATLLVLLGASGAGKSSFLRAGLWPRLHRNNRDFLPLPVIRPESAVLTGESGLAHSLSTAFAEHNIIKNLAEIKTELASYAGFERLLTEVHQFASRGLPDDSKPPTIVLPLDQGEELFSTEGRSEAETLFSYLGKCLVPEMNAHAVAGTVRPHVIVIIAIRSDSYEPLQVHPALRLVTREQFDLLPIPREDYKELILRPSERATKAGRKLIMDPDLVKALRDEAEGADALPLLAYILERLFIEYGSDGDLRLNEYQRFGGVKGAIDHAITSALRNPSHEPRIPETIEEQHRCLQAAFIPWLARIDPATETRQRRVAPLKKIPAESHSVITRLINARLLTSRSGIVDGTNEMQVEIAHEALLRQWTPLDGWLRDDAVNLMSLETVKQSAREWNKNRGGRDWLLRGDRLRTAERLRLREDLTPLLGKEGEAYLAFCRHTEEQEQAEQEKQLKRTARMQKRIGTLLAVVAVVLIIGILGVLMQTREVGRKKSLALAAQSKIASDEGNYGRALRFAVLAARETVLSPLSAEGELQLSRSAHASTLVSQFTHDANVLSAAFSPDGTKVVTASDDHTAGIWEVATGKELTRLRHEGIVWFAAFSPDGTKVVTASFDQTFRIWKVGTGKELTRLRHEGAIHSAAFSPDGTKAVTASLDHTARIWEVGTGKELTRLRHEGIVWFAAFRISFQDACELHISRKLVT